MDPNLNRNAMGSRAGTALKPKFGAGGLAAPTRQGTAGRVTRRRDRDQRREEWGRQ